MTVMSRKTKTEEYHRFFTVTDPRTHEKGHTEYKVTARFVSKTQPENVKEVVVWKRYSELKKLHGELAYTHRNLFRRLEEFPPFPRAQVFGRFDEAVIEERRNAAEVMLVFATKIPALYNSPQLKEFFRGGEVRRPLDTSTVDTSLPPPLIPLPERDTGLLAEEEAGREAPIQTQELQSNQRLTDLAKPEIALEALSDTESSLAQNTSEIQKGNDREGEIKAHQNNATDQCSAAIQNTDVCPSPKSLDSPVDDLEEFDSLFDSGLEEHTDKSLPLLSDTDLAIFDPCAKEEQQYGSPRHAELLSVPLTGANGSDRDACYVSQATEELNAAQERERAADYSAAVQRYRTAVDILMKGVQGDVDLKRRDSVKRKIAEVLEHAERLLLQTPTHNQNT
ncbi:sorting nexin-15 [Misgurnus anguillicaudatus]|uniref:sorting nexin-15 n=1 Tax=Misgurnus anguillicaudatus TaxID=75329 RepID=UPI002434830A|nr:sorting nexin-15 [Misgurnus anguillicaudatus]